MFNSVLGALSSDMAIDMGSAVTRIFVLGQGEVCREASLVAIVEDREGRRRILAVGNQTEVMIGRTPGDVQVLTPVQHGTVIDFEVAEAMLRMLMTRVQGRRRSRLGLARGSV